MRGLWDHEQPLSPVLLQTAVGLFTWMMAGLAGLNVLGAIGTLFQGQIFAALVRLLAGTAIPYALWLAVRMLADILILQNRTAEQMARLLDPQGAPPRSTQPAQDRPDQI